MEEKDSGACIPCGVPGIWLTALGVGCLCLSSVFLYLSFDDFLSDDPSVQTSVIINLTLARLAGIAAFIVGVVKIFNQEWTSGSLLLIGSLALPFISLLLHGTL